MADRIVLRPWTRADVEALLAIFASDPELERQFPYPVTTIAEATTLIDEVLVCTPEKVQVAITVDDVAVGNVAVTHIERQHETGWVSYLAGRWIRGRGIVSRSAATVCTWALTEFGLHRLELGHRVNNPASGGVALAAGFVREGTERDKLRYGDERFDVYRYARLSTDPAPPADPHVMITGVPTIS